MGATKYHISTNGQVATCRAEIKCRLTDISGEGEAKHFETKQEAQAYAEKAMSEKHNVTKSAGRNKAEFTIPRMVTHEEFSGHAFDGGNYLKLAQEQGVDKAVDSKVIASEMKKDIKQAIKAGVLPQSLDGKKVSYQIKTSNKKEHSEPHIEIKVLVDESALDYEPHFEYNSISPSSSTFSMQSASAEKLSHATKTLVSLSDSYNFRSPARPGGKEMNFSPSINVVASRGEDKDVVKKHEREAVKAVVNTFTSGKYPLDSSSYYYTPELVERALETNPEARKAVEKWVHSENEYSISTSAKENAYKEFAEIRSAEYSYKISNKEARSRKENLVSKVKDDYQNHKDDLAERKTAISEAEKFKDMKFHHDKKELEERQAKKKLKGFSRKVGLALHNMKTE